VRADTTDTVETQRDRQTGRHTQRERRLKRENRLRTDSIFFFQPPEVRRWVIANIILEVSSVEYSGDELSDLEKEKFSINV
jgi:hypothetical protein